MTNAPLWIWLAIAFVFGICIGSFLNVVIYRLPKDQSLLNPSASYCPNCHHSLGWLDLIPLLSYLALGRKCRYCKVPIASRYFQNELITGLLFVAITYQTQADTLPTFTWLAFVSVLVPIYFIDLATFTIPISLTLICTFIPFVRDAYGIASHEPGFELMFGWMPRSVFGGIVGACIFGGVRILGWIWKRVEAMGLGDVLLARGMGAMLAISVPLGSYPLKHFLFWVLACCLSGAIVGPAMILIRKRATATTADYLPDESIASATEEETFDEPESNFFRELYDVAWVLFFGDLFEYIRFTFFPKKEIKLNASEAVKDEGVEEDTVETVKSEAVQDDFIPAPTAIPFGPFMVVGVLLTFFWGEWATVAYWAYTFGGQK